MERQGCPLLDHESLSSILVLLFFDQVKFNTLRLHRVIRNLCYHVPTREWIIRSLIAIMEKSNAKKDKERKCTAGPRPKWLNLRLDAALGTRDNLFNIRQLHSDNSEEDEESCAMVSEIIIHQQAAPVICSHALELLIALAKSFPLHFLPVKNSPERQNELQKSKDAKKLRDEQPGPSSASSTISTPIVKDFWNILMRLDTTVSDRIFTEPDDYESDIKINPIDLIESESDETFADSPFGQLITMLSYTVVKRSCPLTDKLLRLLSLISVGLPDEIPNDIQSSDDVMEQINDLLNNLKNPTVIMSKTLLPGIDQQLKITIDVLTSKSCSEEGLEDATTLLLNLSQYSIKTRTIILTLLIKGSKDLAWIVEEHINLLMNELKNLNYEKKEMVKEVDERQKQLDDETEQIKSSRGGILKNRFTKEDVIIMAPTNIKTTSCDLQLPGMAPLVTKTSSQSFFLRILKVIIQIREAVIESVKKENGRIADENQLNQEINDDDDDDNDDDDNNTTSSALNKKSKVKQIIPNPHDLLPLSETLGLEKLWSTLSDCLLQLELTPDHHAVLVLQPTVEAFFLVHSSSIQRIYRTEEAEPLNDLPMHVETTATSVDLAPVSPIHISVSDDQPSTPSSSTIVQPTTTTTAPTTTAPILTNSHVGTAKSDQKKFLNFAEKHRTVLNQILRQSTGHLADGPFGCLVNHARVLDFDVKRRFFRTELERNDEGIRREELAVHVHRVTVFEDSFRELYRRNPEEWKNRFYIVFEGLLNIHFLLFFFNFCFCFFL